MLSLPFCITVVAGYRIAWWRSSCPSPVVSTGQKPMLNWDRPGDDHYGRSSKYVASKKYSRCISCFFLLPGWTRQPFRTMKLETTQFPFHDVGVWSGRSGTETPKKKVSPEMPVALWLMNLYIVIGFFTPLGFWSQDSGPSPLLGSTFLYKNNSKKEGLFWECNTCNGKQVERSSGFEFLV